MNDASRVMDAAEKLKAWLNVNNPDPFNNLAEPFRLHLREGVDPYAGKPIEASPELKALFGMLREEI